MEFPGRDWWFLGVVGLLVVPVQVALIPVAELFGKIGLFGTIFGVVLFHVGFGLPFAIFLLRNFFAEIPRELLEAARLDGAGETPAVHPGRDAARRARDRVARASSSSCGCGTTCWSRWCSRTPSRPPITVALQQQVRQFGNNIDVLAPGAFISMVIPLAVFFAFQRQFVSGVMAGAVK